MYDTIHRKCLAVVWAVLLLRPFLEVPHFTILTDNDGLRWVLILTTRLENARPGASDSLNSGSMSCTGPGLNIKLQTPYPGFGPMDTTFFS